MKSAQEMFEQIVRECIEPSGLATARWDVRDFVEYWDGVLEVLTTGNGREDAEERDGIWTTTKMADEIRKMSDEQDPEYWAQVIIKLEEDAGYELDPEMEEYNITEIAQEMIKKYNDVNKDVEDFSIEYEMERHGFTFDDSDFEKYDWLEGMDDESREELEDAIKDEILRICKKPMSNKEMVEKLKGFDLTTVAMWMMESIPSTLTEMQEMVLGESDDGEYTDEQNTAFENAFWQAICDANVTKEEM